MRAAFLPASNTPNSFASALSRSAHPGLFSHSEKRVLLGLCTFVFSIPLVISVVALKSQTHPTASLDTNRTAYLAPGKNLAAGDDLAMVEIFLSKAGEAGEDLTKSAQYLSSAQSLLALTSETGTRKEELTRKLAGLMTADGSPLSPVGSSAVQPQRVAAPAGSKTSLSTQSLGNAVSGTVVMPAGSTRLFVSYPALKADTNVYVTIPGNRDNVVVYVSQRQTGQGFTLASASPVRQDTTITWYEIETE